MIIKTLNVKNFRNITDGNFSFENGINIIYGNNAQGKTTLIEAIYFLALTKSHRTKQDIDMIKNNENFSKISSVVNLNKKNIELSIVLSKLGKKAKYNQIEMKKLSEYIGKLNVVIFSPEDLDIVKGGPQVRRKFIDIEVGQISKEYLYDLSQYKLILKQRNELLKKLNNHEPQDYMLLDVITEQLITHLKKIVNKRKEFVKELNYYARKMHQLLSSDLEDIVIHYVPSVDSDYQKEYQQKYTQDIQKNTTTIGAHRDDLEILVNGMNAKKYCSQGQIRTVILSLKLGMVQYIFDKTNTYPVLLLDDVLSELDFNRQQKLFSVIGKNIQTLITTTSIEELHIKDIDKCKLLYIENGVLRRERI